MREYINILIEHVLRILFPPRCLVCDELLAFHEKETCLACCVERFLITGKTCSCCGRGIGPYETLCSQCMKQDYAFDQGRGLFHYQGILHSTFYRLKYSNRQDIGRQFGQLITYHLRDCLELWKGSTLMPVPLHSNRLKKRGYNQAEVIARMISEECKMDLNIKALKRIKDTKVQSSLSAQSRQYNLDNAFEIEFHDGKIPESVILIDDILTTGSTLHHCAKVLKEAGVKKVNFIAVAIASMN